MDEIKTADELQQLLNQSEADKAELQTKLDETLAANAALVAEVEKLTSKESIIKKAEDAVINIAEHFFSHEGKKYGFNYPKLSLKGNVITPVEVKASAELQKHLVDANHSMIKEIK